MTSSSAATAAGTAARPAHRRPRAAEQPARQQRRLAPDAVRHGAAGRAEQQPDDRAHGGHLRRHQREPGHVAVHHVDQDLQGGRLTQPAGQGLQHAHRALQEDLAALRRGELVVVGPHQHQQTPLY